MYDNTALSVRAVVLAALAIFGYFVSMVLCWLVYPRHHGNLEVSGGNQEKESQLANGDTETEGGGGEREEGEGGNMTHSSVIGQMQARDSMAELLEEVGSNKDSLSDSKL